MERIKNLHGEVRIAVVGKYVDLPDAYISIAESLTAAGIKYGVNVKPVWVASDTLKGEGCDRILGDVHGILVPGGFGIRGIEGKIMATQFAREKDIPFLGICLGLQCAVIEFARDVGGMESANSAEFDPETPYPVIDLMAHQKEVDELGGTMRLGLYPCRLTKGTRAHDAYGDEVIYERHRHRYEVSNNLRNKLEEAGLNFSGVSPDGRLVEIIEVPEHPWFVACQFHPEFKSRPLRPHPLFREFVRASIERQRLSGSNPAVTEGNEARELK